ncbi:MAG: 2'-5' RNA ligase family protein [Candidatus Saccharibacteria bacterium]
MNETIHPHEAHPIIVFHDLESVQSDIKLDTWPLHISITPFFTLQNVAPEKAIDVITTTAQKHGRVQIKLGEQVMYGPDNDTLVTQIIDSDGELTYLHRSLIHNLGRIGCQFTDLTYALSRYSPHISHKSSNPIPTSIQSINSISVATKLPKIVGANKIILNNIPLD